MRMHDYPLYPLFSPPYRTKDLKSMKKKAAREAFTWFVAESPKRIGLLLEGVERDTGFRPDHTEDSLVSIWRWAIPYFTPRNTPPCNIKLEDTGIPLSASNEGLHIVGLCLTFDIGYYLAEMFMQRSPQVKWMLWERKTWYPNEAVLSGIYSIPVSPRHIVQLLALDVLNGNSDERRLLKYFCQTTQDLKSPAKTPETL